MGLQKYSTVAVTTKLRTVVLASAESWSSSSLEYVGGATVFLLAVSDPRLLSTYILWICWKFPCENAKIIHSISCVRTYILRTYFPGGCALDLSWLVVCN